jgi:hypothetical protein
MNSRRRVRHPLLLCAYPIVAGPAWERAESPISLATREAAPGPPLPTCVLHKVGSVGWGYFGATAQVNCFDQLCETSSGADDHAGRLATAEEIGKALRTGLPRPKRFAVSNIDRLVFAGLYHLAPEVLDAVKIPKPETIIRWHRTGFRVSPMIL